MKKLNSYLYIFATLLFLSCKKDEVETDSGVLSLDVEVFIPNFNENLRSIFFINEQEGYVCSVSGAIYKTVDGANTWNLIRKPTKVPIEDIWFLNSQKGFAVGRQGGNCDSKSCPGWVILKTSDGGATWENVYNTPGNFEIRTIRFVTDLVGFCGGSDKIYKTKDGGQTWSEIKFNIPGDKIQTIKFFGTKRGYAITLKNIIITKDGGETWDVTTPNAGKGYISISEAKGAIYVCGQGKIIKSTNDGKFWEELPTSPPGLFEIHFISDIKGFAFGAGNYSQNNSNGIWPGYQYGAAYSTENRGKTWNGTEDLKEAGQIIAISFPSKKIGYATGYIDAGYSRVVKFTVK